MTQKVNVWFRVTKQSVSFKTCPDRSLESQRQRYLILVLLKAYWMFFKARNFRMNAGSMRLSIHFVIGSLAVFLLFTESTEAEDKNIWLNFTILKQSELYFIVRLKECSYIRWTHVRFAEWCGCSCSFTDWSDVNYVLLNFNVCWLSAEFNFRTESALVNVWNMHLCRPLPRNLANI